MENNDHKPPRWALLFFRWFCHPAHREELEGDLLERFHQEMNTSGSGKAKRRFIKEVFLLLRASVIFSKGTFTVQSLPGRTRRNWLRLLLINFCFVILVLLPCMPGPFTKPAAALSFAARWMAVFGIIVVPLALLWLIREIRTSIRPVQMMNNWTNGYYFSIIAMVLCGVIASFVLFLVAHEFGIPSFRLALFIFLLVFILALLGIRNLRRSRPLAFNFTPLYLLTIPLIVFIIQLYAVLPVSHYSRNYIIAKSRAVIYAIEQYKSEKGYYPASLNELSGNYWRSIPRPGTMGVSEFRYEKIFDDYQLYFMQWQHFGATQEIVIYNKNENHHMRGHFASFDAGEKHWKYYWLD